MGEDIKSMESGKIPRQKKIEGTERKRKRVEWKGSTSPDAHAPPDHVHLMRLLFIPCPYSTQKSLNEDIDEDRRIPQAEKGRLIFP